MATPGFHLRSLLSQMLRSSALKFRILGADQPSTSQLAIMPHREAFTSQLAATTCPSSRLYVQMGLDL